MTISGNIYCADCGVSVKHLFEYDFKLKPEIWLKFANSSEILCIGCIEKESRLNRRLTINDFSNDYINSKPFKRVVKSARLLNRLDIRRG